MDRVHGGDGPNLGDELRRLGVPTLVIHGSADTLIQPDGGRHTAAVLPGARYVELDGSGTIFRRPAGRCRPTR